MVQEFFLDVILRVRGRPAGRAPVRGRPGPRAGPAGPRIFVCVEGRGDMDNAA